MDMVDDKKFNQLSILFPVILTLCIVFLYGAFDDVGLLSMSVPMIVVIALAIILTGAFFINQPNEARIIQFFGYYVGTHFKRGMFITIPLATRYIISLKFNNFNTEKIKVNDADGNPIEISAVIIWRVYSPARAHYNVENYKKFVAIQSESVVRELASNYPYDSEGDKESLRRNSEQIASELQLMLQKRLDIAGVEVIEARISHLAYSSEIAQVMLKRQQAYAVTSARKLIVQNAVEIIELVIAHFESGKSVKFNDKEKIQLINNLLISLISDRDAQPIISLDKV